MSPPVRCLSTAKVKRASGHLILSSLREGVIIKMSPIPPTDLIIQTLAVGFLLRTLRIPFVRVFRTRLLTLTFLLGLSIWAGRRTFLLRRVIRRVRM